MESKTKIAAAIIQVMAAVKGVEKNMTVGAGNSSYKGVSDKDVKLAIGKAMEDNGLCILPIAVEAKTQIDRWEETSQWNGKDVVKTKQSVMTEVFTKYLLLHTSGESIELAGYGHGVDSQDKAAGKATTYALKNTLLYAFMVPTGTIEDTDKEHSDDKAIPPSVIRTAIDKAIKELAKADNMEQLDGMFKYNVNINKEPEYQTAYRNRRKQLQEVAAN